MMAALLQHYQAFNWEAHLGGRAFDYTVATLRRRYLNLKALFYGGSLLPEELPGAAAK